jgi:DNA processing protein
MADPAAERIAWLRLARSAGVGAATFELVLRRYGTAVAALEAVPDLARRGGGATRLATVTEAEAEIEAGERLGASLILRGDAAFPPLLAALDAPPPLLWAHGRTELLVKPTVAIVGARSASAAGRRFAQDLAADLGAAGWVIVSGMARGIDAAAHVGALASGTVAVLAGGIDDAFPPENVELIAQVRERGCLVSERPPGFTARAKDFPRRNRIISGLAKGVVVVEAELRSGSLITARLAGEQGREVFAVPGSPLDPRARGANNLLRQGACLVEDADDVRRVLEGCMIEPFAPARRPPDRDEWDNTEGGEAIAGLLSPTPTAIDELARQAGIAVSAAQAALVELSLVGKAQLLPGGLAARR